jgi:peptide-methionine (S)-S-oxide reductase
MSKVATFAAGCFWGVEEAFLISNKVISTRVGYTGGHGENPTYRQVCAGGTGHAEAVEVTFDPQQTSYTDLLGIFWRVHDPTTRDRQGPDVGSQYRSCIFFHDEEQHRAAEASLSEQQTTLSKKIVTQIVPAAPFYPAEEYHQQYIRKRGHSSCRI